MHKMIPADYINKVQGLLGHLYKTVCQVLCCKQGNENNRIIPVLLGLSC